MTATGQVTFLSEDVTLMGYAFDYVPTHFIKELLVHEAHRHPYIERLAQFYLMKVKYRESFCTDAGAVWRQLFVTALMPWLKKNRVFREARTKMAIEGLAMRQLEAEEDEQGVVDRFGNDMAHVGHGVGELGTGLATTGGQAFAAAEDAIEAVGHHVGVLAENSTGDLSEKEVRSP